METGVFLIGLSNGVELIANILEEQETLFLVDKPVALLFVPDEKTGTFSVRFERYAPHAQDYIMVFKNSVSYMGFPKNELEQQYKQITSPIILPNKGIEVPN